MNYNVNNIVDDNNDVSISKLADNIDTEYISQDSNNIHDIVKQVYGIQYYNTIWDNVELACSLEYAIHNYENVVTNEKAFSSRCSEKRDFSVVIDESFHKDDKNTFSSLTNLTSTAKFLLPTDDSCLGDDIHTTKMTVQHNNPNPPCSKVIHPNINTNTKQNLQIFYQNTRGLKTKTHDFFLNLLSEDYDAVALVETFLSPDITNGELFDSRYEVFRQDRTKEQTGKSSAGGVLFAVKKNIQTVPLNKWNTCTKDIESLWLKCKLHGIDTFIGVIYFPPPVKTETVKKFVESIIQEDQLLQNRVFLIGDFNIREFGVTSPTRSGPLSEINRLLDVLELKSFNTIRNFQDKTLDLCLSNIEKYDVSKNKNNSARIKIDKALDGLVNTDPYHPPLIVNLQIIKSDNAHQPTKQTGKYLFQKANYPALHENLSSVKWNILDSAETPDEKLLLLYEKMNEALTACVPKSTPNFSKKRKFPHWWQLLTKTHYRKKERLRKTKNKTNVQINQYKKLRKQCKQEITQDYKIYIQKITAEIKSGNSKSFWQFTKEKRRADEKNCLIYQGREITNLQEIVNCFTSHFKNSYSNVKSKYCFNEDQNHSDNRYIHIDTITENDVLEEIKNMPQNKPPGPDKLPPLLFKKYGTILATPLAKIFTSSLQYKEFPSQLKESVVKPIPKKGSDSDIENFRPISNLNVIAKIYEGILYRKISRHIFSNIAPQQHGFVKSKSTVSNLIEFTDYTARCIASKNQLDVIYTDVQKCFDKINHDEIIKKLIDIGFSPPLVQLFISYLRDRKAFVSYKNITSHHFSPPSGVGQGSKLSSLLFILTYNDIYKQINHSQLLLYADDLKIFKIIKNTNDCHLLQKDLDNINLWLASIGLNFHPQKCSIVTYSNKTQKINHDYTLNNIILKRETTVKDLGITFTDNLNFEQHRNDITKKAYKKLGMIIRYSKPIEDPDAIRILYQAHVRSVLEYGSQIWIPETQVGKKQIEKIQKCFVRYLFKKINNFYPLYPHYIPYKLLIEHLALDSLEMRRETEHLNLIKKVFSNQIDSTYMLKQLKIRVPNNRIRHNVNKILFQIPNARDSYAFKSPIISAMNKYNKISEKPEIF